MYDPSQAGHVANEEGTVCGRMSPTDRLRRHKERDHMRPYGPSQAGHSAIGEATICNHMSPHRPATAP